MGLFHFGKKKKKQADLESAGQDSAFFDSEKETQSKEIIPATREEEWLYETIKGYADDAIYTMEGVELKEEGLCLWAEFYQQNPQVMQMSLHCSHESFTDDIEEFLISTGPDRDKQLEGLAAQITGLVLEPVLHGLSRRSGTSEEVMVMDEPHRFYVCESDTVCRFKSREEFQSQVPDKSLWLRFKDQILPFIGKKRNYWIKLYQSHFGDSVFCEVRINNRVVHELTEILEQDVRQYEVTDWEQKETCFLIQDPETSIEYPYTARQVRRYSRQAIELFASEIGYDDIYSVLAEVTGDDSLSADLFHLIPEIFCFLCFPDADRIHKEFLLRREGEKKSSMVYATQLSAYGWCEEAIEKYLSEERPEREIIGKIINYSSTAKALSPIIQKGGSVKGLKHALLLPVPEDYVLR